MFDERFAGMHPQERNALADVFTTLVDNLKQRGFSREELIGLLGADEPGIPAAAFASELTPLETIARHAAGDELALLGRPKSVLDQAYANSMRKHPQPLPDPGKEFRIPYTVFADKTNSALEHICVYLREHYRLRNKEIAQIIGRDQRTVAAVLHRASKKRGERDA